MQTPFQAVRAENDYAYSVSSKQFESGRKKFSPPLAFSHAVPALQGGDDK